MIIPNTKRHPSNTKMDQLPIFEVITGLPRPTFTLAHPDEPYMQKYGKFGKNRAPLLDHESKMRLLKAHSHNSERPGYEARKNAKKSN